jgi:hypothetical protein
MIALIDADFRPQKATVSVLTPYLSQAWRKYLRLRGDGMRTPGTFIDLPESVYWTPGSDRRGSSSAPVSLANINERRTVDSDVDVVEAARAELDAGGIDRAIFNPATAANLSGSGGLDYVRAVMSATNDWTVREWLDQNDRLFGSILVSVKDPRAAAAEIRRMASEPRMAQIIFAYPTRLLGDRFLYPVYEAAVEAGLPIQLQAGGAFTGQNRGLTGAGHPATRFEYDVSWVYGGQPHLLSMISNGTFDRYPELRLILGGFGIAWLPSLLWRLEAELRSVAGRASATMQRAPREYLRDQVRFMTHGLEVPDDPAQLHELLSMVEGEKLLIMGSALEAPADVIEMLSRALPDEWLGAVLQGNARSFYRLDRRVSAAG